MSLKFWHEAATRSRGTPAPEACASLRTRSSWCSISRSRAQDQTCTGPKDISPYLKELVSQHPNIKARLLHAVSSLTLFGSADLLSDAESDISCTPVGGRTSAACPVTLFMIQARWLLHAVLQVCFDAHTSPPDPVADMTAPSFNNQVLSDSWMYVYLDTTWTIPHR
jgi:hypothetical protein